MENRNSERLEHLATLASYYYEEGLSQRKIAERMGYSISMVSRLLLEARREGVVEIRIHRQLHRNIKLETQLQERLGLQLVRVLQHEFTQSDQMMINLGRLAGQLVEELLHDNITIGVSVGQGVAVTVNAIRSGTCLGAHVLQLSGTYRTHRFEGDGLALTQQLARTLIGYYTHLPAPLFVPDEKTQIALLADPQIRRGFDQFCRVQLALVGIGTLDLGNSELVTAGYLNAEDLLTLEQYGAIGDVCGHFLDLYGNIVDSPLPLRTIGISPHELVAIPVTVAVAGGLHKVLPIIGAARAKLFNVLVTDEVAAQKIMAFFNRIEAGYTLSERSRIYG